LDAAGTLETLAQVSVTLSGFSGLVVALSAAWRANRRLTRAGHPSVIPGVWATRSPLIVLITGLQVANGLGLFAAQSFGAYLLVTLLPLGMACLMFVAFLIYPSRR
jgi:hypothetical protein